MVEHNKVHAKLSDSQLNKLKFSVKYQTGVTLRLNINMFNGKKLHFDLLLTTQQKNFRNALVNNMSTDISSSS